jgi:hypothetical protein
MKVVLKHKFNAKAQVIDKQRFASKKEAKRYLELKELRRIGEVVFFLPQVRFPIYGTGKKYACDFMVFWKDESVTIEDVKGMKTDVYKLKKELIESEYPFMIKEI